MSKWLCANMKDIDGAMVSADGMVANPNLVDTILM